MEKLKAALKKLFVLPPLPAALTALAGYGLLILVFALDVQEPVLRYTSYLASAYALAVTVTGLPRIFKKLGEAAAANPLTRRIRSFSVGERYLTDIRFRSRVSLHIGLTVNLAYIVMKLSAGIYYRSMWFVTLAVYYLLLAVTRLTLLRHRPGSDTAAEFRRYRLCGFILLIMNQALAGIVIFMVHENRGFRYPGVLIYAMAAYSFYAVINAAVGLIKIRRHASPVLSAAKAVDLVAALVSILSLTTAMLAQFGENDDPTFRRSMTASTGGGVCTAVIIMAAYMIWRANRSLRDLRDGGIK